MADLRSSTSASGLSTTWFAAVGCSSSNRILSAERSWEAGAGAGAGAGTGAAATSPSPGRVGSKGLSDRPVSGSTVDPSRRATAGLGLLSDEGAMRPSDGSTTSESSASATGDGSSRSQPSSCTVSRLSGAEISSIGSGAGSTMASSPSSSISSIDSSASVRSGPSQPPSSPCHEGRSASRSMRWLRVASNAAGILPLAGSVQCWRPAASASAAAIFCVSSALSDSVASSPRTTGTFPNEFGPASGGGSKRSKILCEPSSASSLSSLDMNNAPCSRATGRGTREYPNHTSALAIPRVVPVPWTPTPRPPPTRWTWSACPDPLRPASPRHR